MNIISKFTLMATMMLTVLGCRQESGTPLTELEINRIKQEVKEAAEPLMTGWAALDGAVALKSFSPEMVSCFDTLLLDYPSYQKSWDAYTGARQSIDIKTIREDYIILTREYVIDTWVGRVEEVLKSGDTIVYNPVRYTNVFKKAGGQWKIIFAQSSGIPVRKSEDK